MPWTVTDVTATFLRLMQEHREAVGSRLRDLRKARGMSQEDAAHAVGVAVKTWSNWERGRTSPYDSNWKKIGETFDVDPAGIQGSPPSPLGLGEDDDRLARMERQLAGHSQRIEALIEQQNQLCTILERIEDAVAREEKFKQESDDSLHSLIDAAQETVRVLRAEREAGEPVARKPARSRTQRAS